MSWNANLCYGADVFIKMEPPAPTFEDAVKWAGEKVSSLGPVQNPSDPLKWMRDSFTYKAGAGSIVQYGTGYHWVEFRAIV